MCGLSVKVQTESQRLDYMEFQCIYIVETSMAPALIDRRLPCMSQPPMALGGTRRGCG
jgi:hypothetical protein